MSDIDSVLGDIVKDIAMIDGKCLALYNAGHITTLLVNGSKMVLNDNAVQYAFRYYSTVNYSEKKFNCTQAQAAMMLYGLSEKDKFKEYLRQLKIALDSIDIDNL